MSDYRKDFREVQSEYYWSAPRLFGMGFVGLALLCGLGFGLNYVGLVSFGFFAPRYEAVRRDTMIQSRAYTEANLREFYRLRLEYQQAANDDQRATIRAMVVHEAQAVDRSRLPVDLQQFIAQLGG